MGKHLVKGSPVQSDLQAQMGLWCTTLQIVFKPQRPTHGSTHLWLIQALFLGHSELMVHSGRHPGGLPKNVGRQLHTA